MSVMQQLRAAVSVFLLCLLGCGSSEKPAAPEVVDDSVLDAFLNAPDASNIEIRISKETMFITEPLRPDGRVDYLKALNRRASAGITPEKNAAVLLAQAMGPSLYDEPLRRQFFDKLGIPVPPEQGRYFLSMAKFAEQNADIDFDDLYDPLERTKALWSRDELPELAAWLNHNEEPMKVVLQGIERPSYYCPLIVPETEGSGSQLILTRLALVQETRSFARALSVRAMLAVSEGRVEDALNDVVACHRLARHVASGQILIEWLVGATIESIACSTGKKLLETGRLTDMRLQEYERTLTQLQQLPPVVERINFGERFIALDAVTYVANQRDGAMQAMSVLMGRSINFRYPNLHVILSYVDWNIVLRQFNREYDHLCESVKEPRYPARRTALDDCKKHIEQVRANALAQLKKKLTLTDGIDIKWASETVGDFLISTLAAALSSVQKANDRGVTRLQLLRVAVSLERFRKANGSFPNKLNELKSGQDNELLIDLYTEKPFFYKRTDPGYLLYSPGPNQQDDGGQAFDSDPSDDDIVVRMTPAK